MKHVKFFFLIFESFRVFGSRIPLLLGLPLWLLDQVKQETLRNRCPTFFVS